MNKDQLRRMLARQLASYTGPVTKLPTKLAKVYGSLNRNGGTKHVT